MLCYVMYVCMNAYAYIYIYIILFLWQLTFSQSDLTGYSRVSEGYKLIIRGTQLHSNDRFSSKQAYKCPSAGNQQFAMERAFVDDLPIYVLFKSWVYFQ